jgi:O-antigen ligase
MQGGLRWLLLCQSALVYVLIRGGARREEARVERWMFRILLLAAVVSALYGLVDFVSPIPLPHPAADQFIWLRHSILRRAQGVFYESSSFANLCGFFLAIAVGAFFARQERLVGAPRLCLWLSVAILSMAVLVAFSRSAWVSVITTLLVFMGINQRVRFRRGAAFFVLLGLPLAILWRYSPELWDYFLNARVGYLSRVFADPNLASSGRFETWNRLWPILREYPHYLLFSIGYKTLPLTRLFHEEIIADDGYLSLLIETGLLGLGGYLAFSVSVFRTFRSPLRAGRKHLAFWCAALFSFWCGECVQMLSADAYTYWRNMAVFTAVVALVMNRAEREELTGRGTANRGPGASNAPRREARG